MLLSVWRWVGVENFEVFETVVFFETVRMVDCMGVEGGLQNALRHRRPAAGGSTWSWEMSGTWKIGDIRGCG